MSEWLYLVLAVGLVVAYLLITSQTGEERQRDRQLRELRRIRAEMQRARQEVTRTAYRRMEAVRREARQRAREQRWP